MDGSFPNAQFEIKGYYSPCRLDITNKSGGLLVYIKSSIPSRKLLCEDICSSIQAIPFEINLRKKKWLVISIYCLQSQDGFFFLNSLTKISDVFAGKYDNYLKGDFNLESGNTILANVLDSNNLTNLIKTNKFLRLS